MKFLMLVMTAVFSMTAAAETVCSVRNSKYETLKITPDDSSVPAIELGEENATFSASPTGILQFGKYITADKCQARTLLDDESILIADWNCTPAMSTSEYYSFVRLTVNKPEKTGHLTFGFRDVKSSSGQSRQIDFSCR